MSRAAAKQMRDLLVSDRPSPELMRRALYAVSREEWDAWVDQVFDVEGVVDDEPNLPRGCVPYLPCPVSTVVDALDQARVTSADVFVDVGAGLGRTVFLAHLLTAAGCIGIEVQASLMRAAAARADWLDLPRTRFIQGDAVDLIQYITTGTVFFLYCPFGGERLERFLDGLESVARTRPIRICCVAMPVLGRPWLTRLRSTSPTLDLYRSG